MLQGTGLVEVVLRAVLARAALPGAAAEWAGA
jgi:hypothetical protein